MSEKNIPMIATTQPIAKYVHTFFIQSHSFIKFRFVCPLKSKSFTPRRKRLMPDAALEALML